MSNPVSKAGEGRVKPLDEDEAWAIFIALDKAGFVSGIDKSIWGSRDGKRWEVACTPLGREMPVREPDRWNDGTAIWGAR